MRLPTGSAVPNRSLATVWPITATRRLCVTSSFEKAEPEPTGLFVAVK